MNTHWRTRSPPNKQAENTDKTTKNRHIKIIFLLDLSLTVLFWVSAVARLVTPAPIFPSVYRRRALLEIKHSPVCLQVSRRQKDADWRTTGNARVYLLPATTGSKQDSWVETAVYVIVHVLCGVCIEQSRLHCANAIEPPGGRRQSFTPTACSGLGNV